MNVKRYLRQWLKKARQAAQDTSCVFDAVFHSGWGTVICWKASADRQHANLVGKGLNEMVMYSYTESQLTEDEASEKANL